MGVVHTCDNPLLILPPYFRHTLSFHALTHSSSPCRYNTNAHPAEFSADSSTTTSWQSEDGISLATLVVGLEPSISLSKMFVRFSSALPSSVRLQYYSEMDSVWRDLQSFSEDCKGLLGETADQP